MSRLLSPEAAALALRTPGLQLLCRHHPALAQVFVRLLEPVCLADDLRGHDKLLASPLLPLVPAAQRLVGFRGGKPATISTLNDQLYIPRKYPIQSTEGLRAKLRSPREGILPKDCSINFCRSFQPTGLSPKFTLASPHNRVSQFLTRNRLCVHTHCWFCFSENPN